MNSRDPLQHAAELLLIAQSAFAKIAAEDPRPGEPMVRTAACDRACPRCRMECSIVHLSMQHAEGEYRAALAASPGALIHEGLHFSNIAGRA